MVGAPFLSAISLRLPLARMIFHGQGTKTLPPSPRLPPLPSFPMPSQPSPSTPTKITQRKQECHPLGGIQRASLRCIDQEYAVTTPTTLAPACPVMKHPASPPADILLERIRPDYMFCPGREKKRPKFPRSWNWTTADFFLSPLSLLAYFSIPFSENMMVRIIEKNWINPGFEPLASKPGV